MCNPAFNLTVKSRLGAIMSDLESLFASNIKWAEDIKRKEPDFFSNLAKQQALLLIERRVLEQLFVPNLLEEYLVPMQKAGASIVQMDMRSAQPVLDFQGRVTTHDQIIKQWRVSIAPTLLFFGPGGKEVAERMEGGYLPDFYGPYLDERLAKSRQSL